MFLVMDSNGSASELRPLVRLCPCQNNGSCVEDEDVQRQLNSGARFIVLSCECPAGLTGQFCESNFDACVENNDPCFPGVECVNVPPDANQTGYACGPCPSGYHGDGATCIGKTDKISIFFLFHFFYYCHHITFITLHFIALHYFTLIHIVYYTTTH